jgi:murein DD-endopeptidase MepM/ murein hydrolase activator NlpD
MPGPADLYSATGRGAGDAARGVAILRRGRVACLALLSVLLAQPVCAGDMQAPTLVPSKVDWPAAASALGGGSPGEAFAKLNAAEEARFPGVAQSSVPVLLPLDATAPSDGTDRLSASPSGAEFFQAGPAGYDAVFATHLAEVPEFADIAYRDPVYVLISGFAFTYDLGGPPLPQGEPVKELETDFPGIRRTLHEFYVRFSFERYGVPYVAAIFCRDTVAGPRRLSCKQAERVAQYFLHKLKLAGGTPSPTSPAVASPALARPQAVSNDFTYFSPGVIIPGSGITKDTGGRSDDTVYARLRFPMKDAPAFANSQSFNNWGNCDFTGRTWSGSRGHKGASYSCTVNGTPLVFDESVNYAYPWRDNFCEHRRFAVGQCPGGLGHQGQDIRPGSCALVNEGADRCQPYQHEVVAVHDGMILRARKQEALFLFINTPDTHVRVRYMHLSPRLLDSDGIVSGKMVHEGDIVGKVGNFDNVERGTTYHLHFDMQVPTRIGWVFVNPYITLVSSYERLIGARGTEIKPGDSVPVSSAVPPVILNPGEPAVARIPLPRDKASPQEISAAQTRPGKLHAAVHAEKVKAAPIKQAETAQNAGRLSAHKTAHVARKARGTGKPRKIRAADKAHEARTLHKHRGAEAG